MNNEIKEMCHKCKKYPAEYNQTYCEFCLEISDKDDYITNLQEELEEEKRINEEDLKYIDELNDRIEKTVEELELWKPKNKVIQLEIELLLNILNGRSDK